MVAVGMAKLQCDCRMANYSAILRKALDSAGYADVPILTTDPGDTKGMHPGVSMLGARSVIEAAWSFVMLDILEELCRRIRPYERHSGETNRVFDQCVCAIAEASKSGLSREIGAFRQWTKKQTDDPIFKAYRKEYKKRFAWIKAGRITDEQFYAWSEKAREEKKKCDREIISLEDFQQWLRDSKI